MTAVLSILDIIELYMGFKSDKLVEEMHDEGEDALVGKWWSL